MVAIKLRPVGKKGQISYRVVVSQKRSKLQGRFIEDLGWVNRHNDQFEVNKERASYWLGVGAQPTDTVYNLLVSAGVIEGKKRPVHSKKKKSEEEIEAEKKAESAEAETSEEVKAEEPAEEPKVEETKEEEQSEPAESPVEEPAEEIKEESQAEEPKETEEVKEETEEETKEEEKE